MSKIEIQLTDRAPVTLDPAVWEEIACSSDHDGEVECQANRRYYLHVRRHPDGRAIVYGAYETNCQWEHTLRGGELLGADDDVAAAIKRVAEDLGLPDRVTRRCIGSLPAEEI